MGGAYCGFYPSCCRLESWVEEDGKIPPNPTKRTSGHGKAAPLSHIVSAPSQLGASDKVRVLMGQGLANYP